MEHLIVKNNSNYDTEVTLTNMQTNEEQKQICSEKGYLQFETNEGSTYVVSGTVDSQSKKISNISCNSIVTINSEKGILTLSTSTSEPSTLCDIIAEGGNASHVPGDTLESFLSAYTAGANKLLLTVQKTADNKLIAYRYADLDKETDSSGEVEEKTLEEINEIDAGCKFHPGKDFPWKENTKLYRSIHLASIEDVLLTLDDLVDYWLRPGLSDFPTEKRTEIAQEILQLFKNQGRELPVFVADSVEMVNALRNLNQDMKCGLEIESIENNWEEIINLKPEFVIASEDIYGEVANELSNFMPVGINCIKADPDKQIYVPFIVSQDVSGVREMQKQLIVSYTDQWKGTEVDTKKWACGISNGHDVIGILVNGESGMPSSYPSEGDFAASVNVNNGLFINIDPSSYYASAGAVSQFSLGESFVVDVDFTFDNPQIANMMVLAVINQQVWPGYFNHTGPQDTFSPTKGITSAYLKGMNNGFDAHGAAPFVSVEREEKDGFRIMKYTSEASVYEYYGSWYNGDVGSGSTKKGKLRLERRGRFFTGYYQDNDNKEWVGVGTLENTSMNERVYLRLAAKHYPKNGAPSPLAKLNVSYSNLIVRRPKVKG